MLNVIKVKAGFDGVLQSEFVYVLVPVTKYNPITVDKHR